MTSDEDKNNNNTATFVTTILADFVKANPMAIVLFAIFLVIVCLQDIALPHFSGKLVNAIQKQKPLVRPFLYILGVIITIQVLYTFNEWQDTLLFPEMHGYMRDRIINHLLDVHSTNYAEVDVASVLMRATKLPSVLFTFLDHMRYLIVPYLFVYAVTVVYIMSHDIILGLIVLVCLVILYSVVFMSPKSCEDVAFATEKKANIIADEIEDVFNNLMSVYSQNQQEFEKKRIHDQHDDYVDQQRNLAKCVYKIKLMLFPVMAAFIGAFMFRCYLMVKAKRIDTGKFVALFMILTYISNSMWRMINHMRDTIPRWGRIREGLTIFDNVQNKGEVETFHDDVAQAESKRGIAIDHVYYKYPQSHNYIIKDLSLIMKDREKVAIVGRIGCGKSTLLKLIMKYYDPTHGQIYWHSIPYSELSPEEVRTTVGYVHQYPTLFKRTIYENISYGLDTSIVTRDAIYGILKHIDMDTIFENVVGGLDGNVGRKGSKLSGGQKQMVWLLRTFFKKPDILILDEPTASVDAETKIAIQKMLDLVMKDKTVIIVTHDKFLLDVVDRIVTMENGQVVKDVRMQKQGSSNAWWS